MLPEDFLARLRNFHSQEQAMPEDSQSSIVRFGIGLGACFAFMGSVICGYFLTQVLLQTR